MIGLPDQIGRIPGKNPIGIRAQVRSESGLKSDRIPGKNPIGIRAKVRSGSGKKSDRNKNTGQTKMDLTKKPKKT